MPYVLLSEKASAYLVELVAELGADDYLIDRLTEQLEAIAEDPATKTQPAKLPYPPNRLMANFQASGIEARLWGFTVTLRRMPDQEGIYILTINGGRVPDSFDD